VKAAFIGGEQAFAAIEASAAELVAGEPDATIRAIRMAASVKAAIVAADEHEGGARMKLNLGHTIGHALEAAAGYRGVRHGEAVALGLVAAVRVAIGLGRARPGDGARWERLLRQLGLPTDLDGRLAPEVLDYVGVDKKRRGDRVGFVVPCAPGDVQVHPLSVDELRALLGTR
jgi:3-dehydroquinate synthetase